MRPAEGLTTVQRPDAIGSARSTYNRMRSHTTGKNPDLRMSWMAREPVVLTGLAHELGLGYRLPCWPSPWELGTEEDASKPEQIQGSFEFGGHQR